MSSVGLHVAGLLVWRMMDQANEHGHSCSSYICSATQNKRVLKLSYQFFINFMGYSSSMGQKICWALEQQKQTWPESLLFNLTWLDSSWRLKRQLLLDFFHQLCWTFSYPTELSSCQLERANISIERGRAWESSGEDERHWVSEWKASGGQARASLGHG